MAERSTMEEIEEEDIRLQRHCILIMDQDYGGDEDDVLEEGPCVLTLS